MPTVKWLIESDALENNQLLFNALDKQNIEYQESPSVFDKSVLNKYFTDDCVIFVGSLQTAQKIRETNKLYPGIYYNVNAFNCTHYYPVLGEYLLNEDYIMIPFGDLIRRKEHLYKYVGNNRSIFVRPNREDKIFTGKVIEKYRYEEDVYLLRFYGIDACELVVVAEPQNIINEWRFVVVEGKVVTGSLYKDTFVGSEATYPQEAFDLASEIATKYNPDPVWIVDICLTKSGEYRLMEIGCFSCAGLYLCDRDIIVKEVSRVALEDWESQYNLKG